LGGALFTRLPFYSALRNREMSGFFQTYAHENFELLADFIWKGIEVGQFREGPAGRGAVIPGNDHYYLAQGFSTAGVIKRFPSVNWRKK
jgi:hypothetical protein